MHAPHAAAPGDQQRMLREQPIRAVQGFSWLDNIGVHGGDGRLGIYSMLTMAPSSPGGAQGLAQADAEAFPPDMAPRPIGRLGNASVT